jgi:patatin-related protein
MSGGVSLAVWMGGVAREMNLLQEASNLRQQANVSARAQKPGSGSAGVAADAPDKADGRPGAGGAIDQDDQCRDLYLALLKLLNVTVTMDVLSGTSAGGINAALLGLSSAAGVDLGGLRELWLTAGSLDTLLRDPREKAPPSLLQGDKVLFAQLDSGIRNLYQHRFPVGDSGIAAPSTTVFITTTMMSAETSRFTDDYGTLVPDVDHHGLFTFDEQALASGDALTALALAARSSASFPGAFEPSFVPINAQIAADAGVPERPDMADFANMTRSHWAADGGLLANRPLTPLLAKVFSQPATGQVRRVLAFVVPDGGGTTRTTPQAVAGDDWEHPPTLAGALKADLGAQQSQSIAGDLQAARTHNERIDARHGLRRSLAELGSRLRSEDQQPPGSPPSDGLVTGRLLHEFERQQGSGLAQPLLTEVMRQLTTMQIPAAWAGQLAPGQQAETRMAKEMVHILGRGWHETQPAQRPGEGRAAPRAAAPSAADEEAAAWTAWTATADPYARAAMFGLPVFLAAQALVIHLIRRGYQRATDRGLRNKLAEHRAAVDDCSTPLPPGWTDESGQVRGYLKQAVAPGPDGRYRDLEVVAADLAEQKRQALLIGDGAVALQGAWARLAEATQSLLADLRPLSAADGRPSRADAAEAIGVYQRYFGDALEPPQVADRLLKLALAERALLPADAELDQPVEFVQFSANTRTLLAPADESAPAPQQLDSVTKLRGVEFHHFAAFYKSSWRAWDWMWGRLDGSGWLVHILLDPRRILAVAEDDPHAYPAGRRAACFATALRDATGLPAGLPGDCLEQDLAFLDDHNAEVPVSLPNSALFLAQAWQNLIAADELPTIGEQINIDNGHDPSLIGTAAAAKQKPPPDRWATTMHNLKQQKAAPEEFARQLPWCPVRQETLAGQLRTPAFAQVATKAAAVGTAALTAAPETPGAIRPVLTSARTVTRTGYMATKVTGGTAWKILLAGTVLALVGGVMATQGMMVVGLTGTIIALVGLYLIVLGAWELHRGVLGALVAITVLALLAALALHWVRIQLWGTGKDINSGLVPRDVLPWLSSTWWGGLAILGGIVLIGVLLSRIPRARPPRNRATQTPVPPAPAAARVPFKEAIPDTASEVLQFMPKNGQQDLAWVDGTIHELNELYNQLLRMQLATDVVGEATEDLTQSEKATVDARCAQIGTPLVQVREGSIILQLSQSTAYGVPVLATLGLILKKGPELAALPHKIQERWYSSAEEAEAARRSYEKLKQQSDIRSIEASASVTQAAIQQSARASIVQ